MTRIDTRQHDLDADTWFPIASNYGIDTTWNGPPYNASASLALLPGSAPVPRAYIIPLRIRRPIRISKVGVGVATSESGKSAKFAIYSRIKGYPYQLVHDVSGTASIASTGLRTVATDIWLGIGVWGLAFVTDGVLSGSVRYRTWDAAGLTFSVNGSFAWVTNRVFVQLFADDWPATLAPGDFTSVVGDPVGLVVGFA